MITSRMKVIPLAGVIATIAMLSMTRGALAAAPVKLVPSSTITTGFEFPQGVAVAPGGNIYVADRPNNRVQELTPTGVFVLMFGKEVNETTKGNICTAASGNKCKAGVEGATVEELHPESVTVDPVSGNVYIAEITIQGETVGRRVEEFTPGGQFVLEIGKEVNATTKGDVCTQEEILACVAPAATAEGSVEHGAFNFAAEQGDLLAVGGPEDRLYVGDEQRVQEFEANGKYKSEIPLTGPSFAPGSRVRGLAVDASGDIYLTARGLTASNIIHEFNASNTEIHSFAVLPRKPSGTEELELDVSIQGLALDPAGRLAVSSNELFREGTETHNLPFGSLYEAATGHLITEFTLPPGGSTGITFNASSELYAATGNELTVYKPEPVAELLTSPATCKPGTEVESSVTLDCSLNGTVNPEGVSETLAGFEWGRTQNLGETIPKQKIEEPKPVSAPIEGVRPNEALYYRLNGEDHNVKAPEQLTSETASFITPAVEPRIVGEPTVSFVTSASAVMSARLNPENATTTYAFQYGPCKENSHTACPESPYIAETAAPQSAVYGLIATTLEAGGLQPATLYHYRLAASNEHETENKTVGGKATGPEGTFMTGPAPIPIAVTGPPEAIAATSATITGSVNPDGRPATYTFELGIYEGPATQYGIVFSAPAGTATLPTTQSLTLTGLQSATTYAYRIKLAGGYGTSYGAPQTFTTQGLPALLTSPTPLALLATPNFPFPKTAVAPKKCRAAYRRDKRSRCVRLKKKKKHKSGRRRHL